MKMPVANGSLLYLTLYDTPPDTPPLYNVYYKGKHMRLMTLIPLSVAPLIGCGLGPLLNRGLLG